MAPSPLAERWWWEDSLAPQWALLRPLLLAQVWWLLARALLWLWEPALWASLL